MSCQKGTALQGPELTKSGWEFDNGRHASRDYFVRGSISPGRHYIWDCSSLSFNFKLGTVGKLGWGRHSGFHVSFYAVVYTMWLKRSTPQNIAIGGAVDTFPHVRRWAAVSGDVTVVLVAIIFTLTPPHFWAHALWKMRDYDDAHVTMMSNFTGEADVRSKMSAFPLLPVLLNASPHFLGIPNASIVGLSAIWDMYSTQQKKNICWALRFSSLGTVISPIGPLWNA